MRLDDSKDKRDAEAGQRRWSVGKEKGQEEGSGVNDLLSLPASSRFLPEWCITMAKLEQLRSLVGSTGRTKRERPRADTHCSFSVFCGLFRAGYNQVRGIVPRRIIQICSFV